MKDGDTIIALSSGAPPSGVAVIRLSGPATGGLLERLSGPLPEPRRLALRSLRWHGEVLDQGLVVLFPAPHSFTGEDCAELQVHGSPAVIRAILRALAAEPGVRLAEAGEFTRRAFTNGKLDLVAIEGLGDLLQAETENQRRLARDRLAGGLSRRVDAWREALLDFRAEIEARLDFSDEGDVGALPAELASRMLDLAADLEHTAGGAAQGRLLREGLRVALAGPPNAGKSSLLNALARSDVAIVSDEAGTTRDLREVAVDLGGQLVVLLDMAGLRDAESKAEAEGVRRAREAIGDADLVLWLHAPDVGDIGSLETTAPIWHIATKRDLAAASPDARHAISVRTGEGIPGLVADLGRFVSERAGTGETVLVSRERDRIALEAAALWVRRAAGSLEALELAAEALRLASDGLARLVGRLDPEQVLDHLFTAFCIGK